MDVEDVGNEVWKELYWRSFFQDIQTDEFGMTTSFKMHDLVHDLAQSIMREECNILDNISSNDLHLHGNTRHLSAPIYRLKRSHFGLSDIPKSLRSSLHVSNAVSSVSLLMKTTSLRAIHESGSETVTELPSSIGDLKHLRTSTIGETSVSEVPQIIWCPRLALPILPSVKDLVLIDCEEVSLSSIYNLHNLRFLQVSAFQELTTIPKSMLRGLSDLEQFHITYFSKLESFPEQMLEGLRPLKAIKIDSCEKLKSLWEGFEDLTSLETLEIKGCPELETFIPTKLAVLPESLGHISSLQYLKISVFPNLASLPELGNLTSLQTLEVGHCPKLLSLPTTIRCLTKLQEFKLKSLQNLSSLPDELAGLTSLEMLLVEDCPKLTSLPMCIQSLTNLKTLAIGDCPMLQRRSNKETGEDWYKIAHIPCVKFYLKARPQHHHEQNAGRILS
ncbi:disease resistance protein RGA2-like [Prosopis cineraria]|uniref:disease resistance protein RGA2-like n=1 Tax=Prosopis cineraria TaxID=364024 RepID=UPI00240F6436|nr:disease resistance protein RGA2-like [Prosopis cineraria]